MLALDTEVYSNYFLLSFKCSETGKVRHFEHYEGHPLDRRSIAGIMAKYPTLSFNGDGFDLPIIAIALTGATTEAIKRVADRIIVDRAPPWTILRDADVTIPSRWDHIDVMNVAPGTASLKIYGGRLHAEKLQDLPIAPDAEITPEQRPLMRDYCVNDLDTTLALWRKLEKPLALRVKMSEQYGLDLRSKSDAQIAETVIKSELSKVSGKEYRAPKLPKSYGFQYKDPKIISFQTERLREVFAAILEHRFTLQANGSVKMPDWLRESKLPVGNAHYQMGIGGLHSNEKQQAIFREEGWQLYELDVGAYYPSIILQQRMAPDTLGADFLKVYQSLYDRRMEAKRTGNKSDSDSLKISLNGSFGKLGSKYSALYSPDLLIQTTITGQLCLLMLIERMETAGITVVSANTDGVVLHHPDSLNRAADKVAWDWMLDTSYNLERTDYTSICSQSVNNYIAVTPEGTTKGKGCFASGGLMKNPNHTIVYRAVAEQIANGTPVEQTINESDDIREFVILRQVKGGAVWDGIELGRAVRFYYSNAFGLGTDIRYATNGNKVPRSEGSAPIMDFPDKIPPDVDRERYINEARKVLESVGCQP